MADADPQTGLPSDEWEGSAGFSGSAETTATPPPHELSLPATVGRYKLLQLIGEGGFGSVYVAEQQHPVRRRVALKIIKLGMDTRQVIARFEQERQALALMDHPGIAKVLDAGATDTGRPYFVMELVKGEPITEYCDKKSLPIPQRLALFAQVCHAVQHAHQKGLIHRDIKPSNVLVAELDGAPVAKIIDFGIAKATQARLTEKTLFTDFQQMIGTPEYMSPEQADGNADIDTRTDVYSLGVLLYELLTGSTPFDSKELRSAAYGQMQKIIREQEPPKPSTLVARRGDTLPTVAAQRKTEPQRLVSALRGELDWIVMRCLEKERARRYDTANGLAMDVGRYLAGEPVLAAPPSASYRLRKFVARHRGAAVAAGVVAATLVLGIVGTTAGLIRAERARRSAVIAQQNEAAARVVAENNGRKADAINRFLLDMLGSADIREAGRHATVAQALERASRDTSKSFVDNPEVEAGIRSVLGRTFLTLGMTDEAEPHIRAALAYAKAQLGERDRQTLERTSDLALLIRERGDVAGAAEMLRTAAATAEVALGPDDGLTLTLRGELANSMRLLSDLQGAEAIYRDVLQRRRRVSGDRDVKTQVAINSLAVTLHDQERLDEAEKLYRETADLSAAALGPDHPDTLTALVNLASIQSSKRDYRTAEVMLVELVPRMQRVFGADHDKTAGAQWALASALARQGRFKDAAAPARDSLRIVRRVQGEKGAEVIDRKRFLAQVLNRLGDLDESVTLYRDVHVTLLAGKGPADPDTLRSAVELANVLWPGAPRGSEKEAEAERLFTSTIDTLSKNPETDPNGLVVSINSYGVFLHDRNRLAEAADCYRRSSEIGERVDGPEHRDTLISRYNYMCALRDLGKLDEAAAMGPQILPGFEKAFGAGHPNLASALANHAATLQRMGRLGDAEPLMLRALEIRRAALGPQNPAVAGSLGELAGLKLESGRPAEAEPLFREALQLRAATRPSSSVRETLAVARWRGGLGECLVWLERFEEAEPLLTEFEAALHQIPEATAKDRERAAQRLAMLYERWGSKQPGDQRRTKLAASWAGKLNELRSATGPTSEPTTGPTGVPTTSRAAVSSGTPG